MAKTFVSRSAGRMGITTCCQPSPPISSRGGSWRLQRRVTWPRRAAQGASRTVPVVFTIGGDPVRFGLVASLNRPGGHVTGVSLLSNVLGAKRIELLCELAPKVSRIALLMNPSNPNAAAEQADAQSGARSLGRETLVLNASNPREIDAAFDELIRARADAFIT